MTTIKAGTINNHLSEALFHLQLAHVFMGLDGASMGDQKVVADLIGKVADLAGGSND